MDRHSFEISFSRIDHFFSTNKRAELKTKTTIIVRFRFEDEIKLGERNLIRARSNFVQLERNYFLFIELIHVTHHRMNEGNGPINLVIIRGEKSINKCINFVVNNKPDE